MNVSKRIGAAWVLAGVVGFAGLGMREATAADEKPKHTLKEIMDVGHKTTKEKESLAKKAMDGKASKDEIKTLTLYYDEMSRMEPPKGDKASWQTKTAALVKATHAIDKGDKAGPALLKAAVNCKACHTAHKPD